MHFNSFVTVRADVKWCEVKVAQSCPTLWDPMDCTVLGILQARILEWVAFPFSGDLPNPRIEPRFPALQADSLPAEPQGKLGSSKVVALGGLRGPCDKWVGRSSHDPSLAGINQLHFTPKATEGQAGLQRRRLRPNYSVTILPFE